MVSQPDTKIRWTTRDIEVLPQNEWTTYEIIDGELFAGRSPHRKHQRVIGKLYRALDEWSEESNLGEPIIDAGLVLSDSDNVIPDLVWVTNETLTAFEDEAGHLTRVPELVVEILSFGKDDIRRDREAKRKLYSTQGVKEYWIADRRAKQLEVYRRTNAQLELIATLETGDTLSSPLLPGFTCSIDQIFD